MTNLNEKFTLDAINIQTRTRMEKGDHQGALGFLDQALTRISEADGVSQAFILSNRGFVLARVKNYPAAIDSYRRSAALFKAQGHQAGIADQHSNIAYAHAQKQEFESALEHFHQARDRYAKLGEESKAGLCQENIAALESLEGD